MKIITLEAMKLFFYILALAALIGCNNLKTNVGLTTDNDLSFITVDSTLRQVLHTIKTEDGSTRVFYQEDFGNQYQLFSKLMDEEVKRDENYINNNWIHLSYDRYNDGYDFYGDGFPDPFFYTVSPDMKKLYVVACIHANSSGWITEYQLYKVDCYTLDVNMIAECAAIEATEDGFTVVQCRCINDGLGVRTSDQIWLMHNEKIDWDGNVNSVSKVEYGHEEMYRRYATPDREYWYLRGFKESSGNESEEDRDYSWM